VEAERAQSQLASIRAQLIQARAELAALLQLPAETLPEAAGSLELSARSYRLEELLAAAAKRPAIRALELAEQAAQNRLDLQRKLRYPDISLGLSHAKEPGFDGNDNISTLNVTLPLPLFRRNAAGIGRAATELTQVQVQQATAKRDARAQVLAVWQRQQTLETRVGRLEQSVLPLLEENQRLSQKAAVAGEIGLAELLLVNRQVLEGRRELLDARTELKLTQIALEAAAGILVPAYGTSQE
ncbi:MAG: TolC family protein, partial [Burkholderiales bacterium]